MSHKHVNIVKAHSKQTKSARSVLNMIADRANNDGLSWPGDELLAQECGVSERTVRRAIAALLKTPELELVQASGKGTYRKFRLTLNESTYPEDAIEDAASKDDIFDELNEELGDLKPDIQEAKPDNRYMIYDSFNRTFCHFDRTNAHLLPDILSLIPDISASSLYIDPLESKEEPSDEPNNNNTHKIVSSSDDYDLPQPPEQSVVVVPKSSPADPFEEMAKLGFAHYCFKEILPSVPVTSGMKTTFALMNEEANGKDDLIREAVLSAKALYQSDEPYSDLSKYALGTLRKILGRAKTNRSGKTNHRQPANGQSKYDIPPEYADIINRPYQASEQPLEQVPEESFTTGRAPEPSNANSEPQSEAERIWSQALDELKLQMTPAIFDTWLKGTKGQALNDGALTVMLENSYTREWIEHQLGKKIERTMKGVAAGVNVCFEIENVMELAA